MRPHSAFCRENGREPAKKDVPRRIGRTKGGLNSKLHTVCDGEGRPIILLLSEGQMSDHKGARLVLDALPPAAHLIADRGYDSAWFRKELEARGIEPCIPSSRSRKVPNAYDTTKPERLEIILAAALDRREEHAERQREHIAELNKRHRIGIAPQAPL